MLIFWLGLGRRGLEKSTEGVEERNRKDVVPELGADRDLSQSGIRALKLNEISLVPSGWEHRV